MKRWAIVCAALLVFFTSSYDNARAEDGAQRCKRDACNAGVCVLNQSKCHACTKGSCAVNASKKCGTKTCACGANCQCGTKAGRCAATCKCGPSCQCAKLRGVAKADCCSNKRTAQATATCGKCGKAICQACGKCTCEECGKSTCVACQGHQQKIAKLKRQLQAAHIKATYQEHVAALRDRAEAREREILFELMEAKEIAAAHEAAREQQVLAHQQQQALVSQLVDLAAHQNAGVDNGQMKLRIEALALENQRLRKTIEELRTHVEQLARDPSEVR